MKKLIAVCLAAALLFCHIGIVTAAPATDAPVMDGATLVTFGDSLTALSTWPRSVATALNMNLVNSGIGGNTTADALARFDRDVAAHDPDFVTLCLATNDFYRVNGAPKVDLDTYTANMQTLITKIKNLGAVPILMTPPFIAEYASGGPTNYPEGTVNAALDKYVEAMRTLAVQNDVMLIDIHSVCDSYDVSSFLVADGVHLSDVGNRVYTDTIVAAMTANFNQDPSAPRVEQPTYPSAEPGVWTKDIVPYDVNDWLIIYPDTAAGENNADGSVSFWNTNGLWPEVHYSPAPEESVTVPVKGSYLTVDMDFEAGSNVMLFFNGPTPTLAYANTYTSLTPHLAAKLPHLQTSGDDILAGQTVTTALALEDIIPADCIADDGTVIFTGVKVFAVGAAGAKVTIRELSVTTTDGTETDTTVYSDKASLLPTTMTAVSANQGYASASLSADGALSVMRDPVDTLSWPSIKVNCNQTIDLSATPYLHLSVTPTSGYANGHLYYTLANGTTGFVQLSQLVSGTADDFVTDTDVYVDLAAYFGMSRTTVTIDYYTLSVYGDIGATVTWNTLAVAGDALDDVVIGDVDKDGTIDTSDAAAILRYVLGDGVFDAFASKAADMNHDGSISTADAREILIHIVNQ